MGLSNTHLFCCQASAVVSTVFEIILGQVFACISRGNLLRTAWSHPKPSHPRFAHALSTRASLAVGQLTAFALRPVKQKASSCAYLHPQHPQTLQPGESNVWHKLWDCSGVASDSWRLLVLDLRKQLAHDTTASRLHSAVVRIGARRAKLDKVLVAHEPCCSQISGCRDTRPMLSRGAGRRGLQCTPVCSRCIATSFASGVNWTVIDFGCRVQGR